MMYGGPSLDLSRATKLKDVEFRCERLSIQRTTMALQTLKSKNLRQITIHPDATLANPIGETVHREWQDLDHLLVRFWTSHSIRPKIKYELREGGNDLRDLVPSLLPELTKRGLVDLVEHAWAEKSYPPHSVLI
jgi:hypothetical protein